nr:anti-CBASS Acb1 family protein [Pantoea cypripedii]
MNESQMKQQRAANASIEKDRRNYLSSLYTGTSNTKRQRLYQEFGYPVELCFDDFYRAYRRNAVAGAAISRMVDGCWEDIPEVYEGDETKDATSLTPWDKRLNKLLKRCWKQIKGADRRNLVGRYSALLIQLRDNKAWNEPVDTAVVGRLSEKALVKLIPAWEAQLDPVEWDSNPQSETFGDVKMYAFTELSVDGNYDAKPGRIINVHPDRVIILAEGSDDGSLTSGKSLLEDGFNKLLDIEKVSGGASEGFLKNASRQLNFNFSEKTNFSALAKALGTTEGQLADALDMQVRRLNDSTDSASFMQAGTAEVLSVAAADPEPTWRTALSEFCATVPIPVKVLVGMQTGERASTEDMKDWARTRMSRRNGFLTDVITDVATRFWTLGIIQAPASGEITVGWSDLLAPSQSEKIANMSAMADVAVKTTNALGRSAISGNEVRAQGELQPDPALDDIDDNQSPDDRPDPLAGGDDEQKATQPGDPEITD